MTLHSAYKEELLFIAPSLQTVASEMRRLFGEDYDPSAMIFFDDILDPYLATTIQSGSPLECKELFDFFERLAASSDEQAVLCVAYAVPRALQDHPQALEMAEPLMGPKTREFIVDYLLRWTTWTRKTLPWLTE